MLATLIKQRDVLTTVSENATLQDALDIFDNSNFRAIPILDESGQLFRGAIYKMHIYRHQVDGGRMDLPVTTYMRNMTKFVGIEATFFEMFFTLRDLPFISVLDKENHFVGIVTHSRMMRLMADSWQTDEGRYTLTLVTDGERGSLEKAAKIITRYTQIASSMTLNPDNNPVRCEFSLRYRTRLMKECCQRLLMCCRARASTWSRLRTYQKHHICKQKTANLPI